MTELPKGWGLACVADIAAYVRGVTYSKADATKEEGASTVKVLRANNLIDSGFDLSDLVHITSSNIVSVQMVRKDDIVLAMSSGSKKHVGKSVLATTDIDAAFGAFCGLLRPNPSAIVPKFLALQLRSQGFRRYVENVAMGTNINNLKSSELLTFITIIPPLPEQHRIVAKIEALFSELDDGQDSLTRAQAQLKLYRQSLLKAAFQGRLTADWRAANPDKLEAPETLLSRIRSERDARYKQALDDWQTALTDWRNSGEVGRKPAKPKRPRDFREDLLDIEIDLPDLPHGWAWDRLGYSTCGVEYGTSAKSSTEGDVPVIRMGNLQNGLIDWTDLVYTSDQDEIEQYLLSDGDVLFNRTNSPELVGKTAIYRGERPALFAGYLVRFNQINTIASSKYICYFLNSHQARRHGDTVKTDGVNQSNINGNKLQEYPFPFCSVEEQAQLILILDEKISAINAIESEITIALAKITALRQSILKQAFSGRLVPQDPADEPASALLARLRNIAPVPKPGRGRKFRA